MFKFRSRPWIGTFYFFAPTPTSAFCGSPSTVIRTKMLRFSHPEQKYVEPLQLARISGQIRLYESAHTKLLKSSVFFSQLIDFGISWNGNYLFTISENSTSMLMWTIHTRYTHSALLLSRFLRSIFYSYRVYNIIIALSINSK